MKNYEKEILNRFGNTKFSGLKQTIASYIDRLIFAREMRSDFMWYEIQREVNAFCYELHNTGNYKQSDVGDLYKFIIETAKKDPL